jgi:hypothetical protein
MEVFTRCAPDRFRRMWEELFADHVAPYGLHQKGSFVTINISEYEGILDVGLQAWQRGVLSDRAFREGAEKVYMMLGSDRCNRTTDNWVVDLKPEQKSEWGWEATPYAGYMDDVRPEGFYDGIAQAFFLEVTHENQSEGSRGILHQFASPGAHHTERLRFGQMSTFNLLDTRSCRPLAAKQKGDVLEAEIECIIPECPSGMSCLGAVDVTDVCFDNKSWYHPRGYEVSGVESEQESLAFKVCHRMGMAPYCHVGIPDCEVWGHALQTLCNRRIRELLIRLIIAPGFQTKGAYM